ncbi:hypothetical protein [Arsenicicoccus sp. oral taxon 190]|uniref:hypothetical protein n=1 Tax=Arsenicicoccus sp. oral taxon 190 TaxID=1658671 RepID=UPI0012E310A7|nr:hypothetical protein [Arsenicicoccus sp. oral taxon 190]
MDRRATTPLLIGLLCFAAAMLIRNSGMRGLLVMVAAGCLIYAVSVMTKDRR